MGEIFALFTQQFPHFHAPFFPSSIHSFNFSSSLVVSAVFKVEQHHTRPAGFLTGNGRCGHLKSILDCVTPPTPRTLGIVVLAQVLVLCCCCCSPQRKMMAVVVA
jgi:hypothetical protein